MIKTTKEELAKLLNGRNIGEEITPEEQKLAKENNLVVVFGSSDDLMEFLGAIYDEVGCYGGDTVYIKDGELLQLPCYNSEFNKCPFFITAKRTYKSIEANWCENKYSWSCATDIPHVTFNIIDHDKNENYHQGIVFSRDDLEKQEEQEEQITIKQEQLDILIKYLFNCIECDPVITNIYEALNNLYIGKDISWLKTRM